MSLVVDRAATRHSLPQAVEAAFANGVDWLQLRERELDGAALLAWGRELVQAATRGAQQASAGGGAPRVVVNRRLDIALALAADGAHLGFDSVRVADARALLGPDAMLGVSTHATDEVAAAARDGASYVHLAPIFAPLSKRSTRPALGLAGVAAAAGHGIDVIAQGGVCAENAREIIHAGAAGVAVTGAILLADDPAGAARRLRAALQAAER